MNTDWFLEGILGPGKNWLIPIAHLPFLIGRDESCNLCLASPDVSRMHAKLTIGEDAIGKDALCIEDLRSKNGTFVNNVKVLDKYPLHHGDIVHFATMEFRVGRHAVSTRNSSQMLSECEKTGIWIKEELPHRFAPREKEFREMLSQKAVKIIFQPIVSLVTGEIVGQEALGRTDFPDLPAKPSQLFAIACNLGLEVQLSEIFLLKALDYDRIIPEGQKIFVNLHPASMDMDYLKGLLQVVAARHLQHSIVFEVSEEAVTDLSMMQEFRNILAANHMYLAYDDFGAGQARLLELMKIPPDYLKFDISFIRQIDKQPEQFRDTLAMLVRLTAGLGIATLAEGIETIREETVCRDLGFTLGQGYLYDALAVNSKIP